MSEQVGEKVRHPQFAAFKERSLQDPEVRAAYELARLRDATYGLDKRQARRVRRRSGLSSAPGADR